MLRLLILLLIAPVMGAIYLSGRMPGEAGTVVVTDDAVSASGFGVIARRGGRSRRQWRRYTNSLKSVWGTGRQQKRSVSFLSVPRTDRSSPQVGSRRFFRSPAEQEAVKVARRRRAAERATRRLPKHGSRRAGKFKSDLRIALRTRKKAHKRNPETKTPFPREILSPEERERVVSLNRKRLEALAIQTRQRDRESRREYFLRMVELAIAGKDITGMASKSVVKAARRAAKRMVAADKRRHRKFFEAHGYTVSLYSCNKEAA